MMIVFGIKSIHNVILNLVKIKINLQIKNVLIIFPLVLSHHNNVEIKYAKIMTIIMIKSVKSRMNNVHLMVDFV